MKDLKELLNNSINEGAWGFKPNESDSAFDKIDNFRNAYIDYLGDVLDNIDPYDFIALMELWTKGLKPLDIDIHDRRIKYYVKEYQKSVKQCLADQEWMDSWKDRKAIENELARRSLVKTIEDIMNIK